VEQMPRDIAKLGRLIGRGFSRPASKEAA
jgi:hypothetical protein